MATKRLSEYDRRQIKNAIKEITGKADNFYPFPIQDNDEIKKWLHTLVPLILKDAYDILAQRVNENFFNHSTYTEVVFYTDMHKYDFMPVHEYMPRFTYNLTEDNPHWGEITDWAFKRCALQKEVVLAESYLCRAIDACSTAGQIKRILPELIGLLPEGIKSSIFQAARISRFPGAWKDEQEPEIETAAHNTLVKCSLMSVDAVISPTVFKVSRK